VREAAGSEEFELELIQSHLKQQKTMQRVKRVREFKHEDDGLGVGKREAFHKQ
jgi:hypothetical protein